MGHFHRQAAEYARYRPDYPDQLFELLAALSTARNRAVDFATGNGQAAASLAKHFARVIAVDSSPEQIAHARSLPNVEYRIADAAHSGLPSASADLVSIFQAIHWMDLPTFYAEVDRVLRPEGVFAVTNYGDVVIPEDEASNNLVQHYNKVTVGSYWPPGRALVDRLFELPFPFQEITVPRFQLQRDWRRAELIGYLRSWSATTRYIEANGKDPLVEFDQALAQHWPDSAIKRVQWPFLVRVGKKIS